MVLLIIIKVAPRVFKQYISHCKYRVHDFRQVHVFAISAPIIIFIIYTAVYGFQIYERCAFIFYSKRRLEKKKKRTLEVK